MRQFRVVGLDSLGGSSAKSEPTAGLDRLTETADGTVRSGRVAGFEGLDADDRPLSRVADLDRLDRSPDRATRTGRRDGPSDDGPIPAARGAPRRGRVPATGSRIRPAPAPDRPAPDAPLPIPATTDPPPAPPDTVDDLPPDAPLPRRRRRRARTSRLGPDAPDPALAEPAADPVAVAREICLRLLTDRARTRQELADALARKSVPAEAADAVLDRFDEVGLIDDTAFAGQWVRSRHTHRGLGRRAIADELRRKGVADPVAREALAEVDGEAEARRARELVDRKLRSLAVATPEQRATAGRRLVGMLARKGYGAGTAYQVVREALAERGAEVDELGEAGPDDHDPTEPAPS
jgi:regulatory protein